MAKPGVAEKILKRIPLGRLGEQEEAAALIAFLAGEHSGFITGQVIPFSGGWA
jgi:3-oxoacyl-[acyl-carrier protein] reductase